MVGYYRLKELGFRLASGAHVIPKQAFEPIEAATALLEEARSQAASIVEDARQAYENERERGYQEGLARARLEAAERLLSESAVLDRKLGEVEDGLAAIVADGVRRLVEGFDDNEKARTVVRAALKQMRREKKAELRVSPQQYAELRQSIADIIKDFPEIELVDVVEDPALTPPHVIVETSIGRVEGDLGRHVDALADVIRYAAGAREPVERGPVERGPVERGPEPAPTAGVAA